MTDLNIDETFTNLQLQLSSMSKTTKLLQDELKTIQKKVKSCSKQKTRVRKEQSKQTLSTELTSFLSLNNETKMTKAEVMKSVSSYIKDHKLQLEDNKRKFKPDTKMTKVFSMKKGTEFTFVEINKHVSGHLSKVAPTTSA